MDRGHQRSRVSACHSDGGSTRGRASSSYLLLLIATAAFGLALAACRGDIDDDRPAIILIVVDTLRADHLGIYGYGRPTSPFLDERSRNAAVFERAFSSSSWTTPAMGSMFTGQLPTRHGAGIVAHRMTNPSPNEVDTLNPEVDDLVNKGNTSFVKLDPGLPTIAQVLRDVGYVSTAIVSNTFLTPNFGFQKSFDDYDFLAGAPNSRTADTTVNLAIDWLEARKDPQQPFFLVVHFIDPHEPYRAPPPFFGRFTGNAEPGSVSEALARYDEEISFTDHELDRFFVALEEQELWDRSIVIFTSDHGESFHEHNSGIGHGHTMFNELLRVPFMAWGPRIEPGRYELPVTTLDIFPTLLEAAGFPLPNDKKCARAAQRGRHRRGCSAGVSLWPVLTKGPRPPGASSIPFDRFLVAEGTLYGTEKKAAIAWPWKIWTDIGTAHTELYQLELDPGETTDVHDRYRDLSYQMIVQLHEIMAETAVATGLSGRDRGVRLTERMLEQLRALGYIR